MNKESQFSRYEVIFYLLPHMVGGRNNFIAGEYTPNAVFGFPAENLRNIWDGQNYKFMGEDSESIRNCGIKIILSGNEKTYPGDLAKAEIILTKEAEHYISHKLLRRGNSFLLREGYRVVGVGKLV